MQPFDCLLMGFFRQRHGRGRLITRHNYNCHDVRLCLMRFDPPFFYILLSSIILSAQRFPKISWQAVFSWKVGLCCIFLNLVLSEIKCFKSVSYASINSSGAHPPRAFAHVVIPGGGALANFIGPGDWALAYPGATPGHLTHAFSKDGWDLCQRLVACPSRTGKTCRCY